VTTPWFFGLIIEALFQIKNQVSMKKHLLKVVALLAVGAVGAVISTKLTPQEYPAKTA